MPYLTIYTKMYKRLQNMRSPRKRQGSVPQRGAAKTALFSADNQDMETDWTDTSYSSDNTILLESNDDISEDNSAEAKEWHQNITAAIRVSLMLRTHDCFTNHVCITNHACKGCFCGPGQSEDAG
uniref:Uncharacterized protein n=1 Tax=Knipowitschia caucasica TaxID=637954 RepID=A0AAV2KMF5_KNICA